MQGLAADIGFTSLISVQPCNSPVDFSVVNDIP